MIICDSQGNIITELKEGETVELFQMRDIKRPDAPFWEYVKHGEEVNK